MNIIKQSFEILEQEDWRDWGAEKQVERVGRTCYKSEDKITPNSYKQFVQRMVSSRHYAMLEHGTLYMQIPISYYDKRRVENYKDNPYSHVNIIDNTGYVTTNLRVLYENHWLNDLRFLSPYTEHHELRITVKFICNRQVSHEFVRHRVFSFAQESTRYCNYSKDKFGSTLTYIKPVGLDLEDEVGRKLINHLFDTECMYFDMIQQGLTPQIAANCLPNMLKTELVMTGFVKDWIHFFNLRSLGTTGKPHPQAEALATPLYKEFINRNYIKYENKLLV